MIALCINLSGLLRSVGTAPSCHLLPYIGLPCARRCRTLPPSLPAQAGVKLVRTPRTKRTEEDEHLRAYNHAKYHVLYHMLDRKQKVSVTKSNQNLNHKGLKPTLKCRYLVRNRAISRTTTNVKHLHCAALEEFIRMDA